MIYIPMTDKNHCNDDIFIRKHYNIDEGYMIYNNHHKEKDSWIYVSRKNFIEYHKNNKL